MTFSDREQRNRACHSDGGECYCCRGRRTKLVNTPINGVRCLDCGCLYKLGGSRNVDIPNTIEHYEHVDPHFSIASAKIATYHGILNRLQESIDKASKRILDIGCGYGYFLEEAKRYGWDTYGVEISPKATAICESKIGNGRVASGEFRSTIFTEEYFDVVTLWDVLDMMSDPKDAIKGIHRILRKNGLVFIRVRNATSQMILYHIGRVMKRVSRRFGVKNLHVFHKYVFTLNALTAMFTEHGFAIIDSGNAQFTKGDPYGHFRHPEFLRIGKQIATVVSASAYHISNKRIALNPSIFVLCRKM